MGQYFKPVIIDEKGKVWAFDPYDYEGGGLKLTEHSWIGNPFVDAVTKAMLADRLDGDGRTINWNTDGTAWNAKRVAWIGDYADGYIDGIVESGKPADFGHGYISDVQQAKTLCSKVWKYDDENPDNDIHVLIPGILPDVRIMDKHRTNWFLVNVSKNSFLDIKKYAEKSADTDGWCLHPLPLLTCVGNGEGGGDYYGKPGQDAVGSWAFDKIILTSTRPDPATYIEETVIFKES